MPTATVNGTELFYETVGTGRPILVMHGGLGHDHSYFRPWLDPLAHGATLIYYDHRGNGHSRASGSLDHDTWIADADALRAHLGHERVVVLGHSYGSVLAQEYALRHPERVDGLILCSSTPAFDYQAVMMQNAATRATPEQLAALQGGLSAPLAGDESYRRLWGLIAPLYFHHYDAGVGARVFGEVRFSAKAFNAGMFHGLPGFNTLARLGELRMPALILSGRADWITPPAQGGARLAAGIAGARHVIFEESGHYPFVEEPARFISVVESWLAALPGALNQALYRRVCEEVFNRGDWRAIPEAFHADYHAVDPALARAGGGARLQQIARTLRANCEDLNYHVEETIAERDLVAARWTLSGRVTGRLFGVEGRNRSFQVTGMSFNRFVDGQSAEAWIVWDVHTLLRQLGAVPEVPAIDA